MSEQKVRLASVESTIDIIRNLYFASKIDRDEYNLRYADRSNAVSMFRAQWEDNSSGNSLSEKIASGVCYIIGYGYSWINPDPHFGYDMEKKQFYTYKVVCANKDEPVETFVRLTRVYHSPARFIRNFIKHDALKQLLNDLPHVKDMTDDNLSAALPYILPPDISDYGVEVWDTPSEMYDSDVISGIDSCMVDEDYPKFYDTAPVKGLVLRSKSGKLTARALLWTMADGRRFIGRTYASNYATADKIYAAWAKKNDVLESAPDDAYVVSPISEWGVPWQDDLGYGVRIGNTLHMFKLHHAAVKFSDKNGDARVWGLCDTGGNDRQLRQVWVDIGGKLIDPDCVGEFDGVKYDMSTLPGWSNRYQVLDADPDELVVVGGLIYRRSTLFQFDGGWYAPHTLDRTESTGKRIPYSRYNYFARY